MKFIRKHKSINEGYFKSVDDIKNNPEKYKVSTIGETARKIIEQTHVPRILYYVYGTLGKYFVRSQGNPLLSSNIMLKTDWRACNTIKIDLAVDILGLYGYEYPFKNMSITKVSDEHIQYWMKYYFSKYFEYANDKDIPWAPWAPKNRGEINLKYGMDFYSPIKEIKFNGSEAEVTVRCFTISNYFCFFTNDYFDAFNKVEKEVSKLTGFPIKIKLSMTEYDDGGRHIEEVPFSGKHMQYASCSFVGNIDFKKFEKFIERFENIDPNGIIQVLSLYDCDIPSLSYLPDLPFKVESIEFNKIWGYGENDFKYKLDAIGTYRNNLRFGKYFASFLDGGPIYTNIAFHPWAFNGKDVERLTDGVITEYEFELSRIKTDSQKRYKSCDSRYYCSYCPYNKVDTSLLSYRQEKYKYSNKEKSSD